MLCRTANQWGDWATRHSPGFQLLPSLYCCLGLFCPNVGLHAHLPERHELPTSLALQPVQISLSLLCPQLGTTHHLGVMHCSEWSERICIGGHTDFCVRLTHFCVGKSFFVGCFQLNVRISWSFFCCFCYNVLDSCPELLLFNILI